MLGIRVALALPNTVIARSQRGNLVALTPRVFEVDLMDEMFEFDFDVSPKPCIDDLLDLLPEFCEYSDEGCELAHACLECPFPRCLHEIRGATREKMNAIRNLEMARLHASGKQVSAIAEIFGVSERTVQRAVLNHSRTTSKVKK